MGDVVQINGRRARVPDAGAWVEGVCRFKCVPLPGGTTLVVGLPPYPESGSMRVYLSPQVCLLVPFTGDDCYDVSVWESWA